MQSKIKQVLDILFSKPIVEESRVIEEPAIEVKPLEKVVQEPFISLVKTFEENPRRFKATRDNVLGVYTLVDTELKNTFKTSLFRNRFGGLIEGEYKDLSVNGIFTHSYTCTDIHYAYNKIASHYTTRCEKYTKLLQQRLHNRLMKNYVK